MDIPAASAGPWIVLGAVLGVLLVALAGAIALGARRRSTRTPAPGPPDDDPADDLPGFLEHPPGSRGTGRRPEGWVALSAPAGVSAPQPAPRPGSSRVLVGMGLVALLLVGAAAAVAVSARDPETAAPGGSATAGGGGGGPTTTAARLSFGGVVLERRAVGVTVTYPTVVLEGSGAGAQATVELPTFNCLSAEAPVDPAAAGCTATGTEFAQLTAPALQVVRDGQELRATGRFATWRRPNGSPPTRTGRVYELAITAAPEGDGTGDGWVPASGTLQLGADRATTVDGEVRYAG